MAERMADMRGTRPGPLHTCHFLPDAPCVACRAMQDGLRAVNQQVLEARRFLDGEFANGNMETVKLDDNWLRLIGAAIAYGRAITDREERQGAEAPADNHARFGFIELEATERQ